jgi:hypothetical protein
MRIKIKVNKPIGEHKIGSIVDVAADDEGTPLDLHWRRRLKDAEFDSCCEVVKPAAKQKPEEAFTKKGGDHPSLERKD